MNLELLRQTLERYSFGGAFALLNPRLSMKVIGGQMGEPIARLQCVITVPDRNTGEPVDVTFMKETRTDLPFRDSERHARLLFDTWLRDIWMHEFYESVRFDNVIAQDPHEGRVLG